MSIKALNWAWGVPMSSTAQKLVLMCYSDYSDEIGKCWPAHATVARKCGISERTVRRHLVELEKAGAVAIKKRAGTTHEIWLNFDYSPPAFEVAIAQESTDQASATLDNLSGGGGQIVQGTPDTAMSRGGGQNVQGTPDKMAGGVDIAVSRGGGHSCVHRSSINHQKILASIHDAGDDELLELGVRHEVPPLPYERITQFRERLVETITRRAESSSTGASA